MSALARSPRALDGWRRPSLFRLLGAVLGGEVLAGVVLLIASAVLGGIGISPIGGARNWVWLPWQIDSAWALVGAIGWGYIVCAGVARLVGDRIDARGYGRPAAGWLRISIALSGYGAMAVGHTAGAHVAAAVLAGALVIRFVAFNLDGSLRDWRWTVPRRVRLAGALAAALAALSYSALHAFAADGSGGSYSSGTIVTRVGHTETVSVGLHQIRLPVDITAVTLTGPGARHASVSSLVLSTNSDATLIPPNLRHQPGAHEFTGYVWHPTRLPYRLAAGKDLWINATVRLASCAAVTINTLRLSYRTLGIATAETIPLQDPLSMSCRR